MKYYDVANLIKSYPKAHYYVVFGERSNGKTYSALKYALERNVALGEQFAYLRRMGEDIRKSELMQLFSAHESENFISSLTGGEWTRVVIVNKRFYFERTEINESSQTKPEKIIRSEEPIGFAFDLNSMEHYKSISFPKIRTVIFDEFLSRTGYLPNEFLLFTNTLSTIIRQRDDVKIIMLGNTVSKYCPYFSEMGLTHIKQQVQGTIDVYNYGNSKLQVVVEYTESSSTRGGKKSDIYFAFDNPELKMITSGSWEIAIYPHLEIKYRPKDVACNFFIEFDREIIHGELVYLETGPFIFFHRKTTPIKDETKDIVYTTRNSQRYNYKMGLTKHTDKLSTTIIKLLRENRAFYSENEVGEIVRNYLKWSISYSMLE